MTPKEAMQQIKDNDCSRFCNGDDQLACSECRWGVAIDALVKQIPKIPYLWGDGYADGEPVVDMYKCPSCGKDYEPDYEKHDYCPNCGQAIDWEVTE